MGRTRFSSTNRTMFSSTTMASSMTMPTARARASSVMMLSVKPMSHIAMKVPMIDVGMARAAMIVLRKLPRKMSTTSDARIAPSTRCSRTASTLVRVLSMLSRMTCSFVPAGSVGSRLLHARAEGVHDGDAVLARLLAGSRRTTASLPLTAAAVSASSSPSTTRWRRRQHEDGVVVDVADDDVAHARDALDAPAHAGER